MGYSSQVQKAAADKLSGRRYNAEVAADRRREEIYAKLPRAAELEKAIADSGIRAVRVVLGGGNAREQMEQLKEKNLALQKELRELLVSNGYPENVFEPQYTCKRCSDRGYYEENNRTLVCPCMKKALAEAACEELNRQAPLALSTFESFRLDYYSRQVDPSSGIVPYQHMEKVLRYCKSYAQSFTPKSNSILMYGNTGLGKTHLSLAIANEVIRRGYGVIYLSAPTLSSQLEKQFFSRNNDDALIQMILDCDLLIIDDLGTEFHSQFSVSQIYNIFNSRMLSGKPMIISTNYEMDELEKIYTDRFVSRINGSAQRLAFLGKDIRVRKK